MSVVLLSTAYLPPINYLLKVLNNDEIVIEKHEHFIKQTYRNRCDILTSNGKLSLTIPLIKNGDKEFITEKKISYSENWQQQHWRAITSSYKNSPYFEFFEDDLKPFYENRFEYLFDYNTRLLHTILHILRVKKRIDFTTQFEADSFVINDFRGLTSINLSSNDFIAKPYYQVFANNNQFNANLSCIDALFNVGLETKEL